MRINQVNGVAFLFTIGFLLLFSSSFLAYLAWEGPGYQGSAAALEAPVMPPSLDSAAPVPPAPPPSAPVEPAPSAGVLETPAETTAPTEEKRPEPEPSKQEAPKKPAAPAAPAKALDAQKPIKPIVEPLTPPDAPRSVQKVEKKPVLEVAKASQATPERKPKSNRKARVKKPTQEENVDITRVPPEWDWFSKPLRMEIQQGKVQILGEANNTPVPLEQIRDEGASEPSETVASRVSTPGEHPPVVPPPTESVEIHSSERPEIAENAPKQVVAESARSERIVSALARLQARQERRDREADAKALLLPSRGGNTKHVPASLVRLMNALKALRSESPAPGDAIASEGVLQAVESDQEVPEAQENSSESLTLRLN